MLFTFLLAVVAAVLLAEAKAAADGLKAAFPQGFRGFAAFAWKFPRFGPKSVETHGNPMEMRVLTL